LNRILESKILTFCILSDERVFHSQSPNIYNNAIRHCGVQAAYVPFMVFESQLGHALQSLEVFNIAGANVTVPYQEKAIPYLDSLSEGANIIRAINAITIKNGVLKGFNTNALGFMKAMEEAGCRIAGQSAMVFGTGGVARAAVFMLNWLRAEPVFVVGRSIEKSKMLVNELGGEALSLEDMPYEKFVAELLINATSVSSPEESPEMAALVEKINIKDCQWVIDLNYGRQDNFWVNLAHKLDTRFMDGFSMLAHQASLSFFLWTGIQIPSLVFLAGLDNAHIKR
jgi:shikimate dehydrogenase